MFKFRDRVCENQIRLKHQLLACTYSSNMPL